MRKGLCKIAPCDGKLWRERHGFLPQCDRFVRLPVEEQIAEIVGCAGILRIGFHSTPKNSDHLPLKWKSIIRRLLSSDAPELCSVPGVAKLFGEMPQVIINQRGDFGFVRRNGYGLLENFAAIFP